MKKTLSAIALVTTLISSAVFAISSNDGGGIPITPCYEKGVYLGTMPINICQSKYKGSPVKH